MEELFATVGAMYRHAFQIAAEGPNDAVDILGQLQVSYRAMRTKTASGNSPRNIKHPSNEYVGISFM